MFKNEIDRPGKVPFSSGMVNSSMRIAYWLGTIGIITLIYNVGFEPSDTALFIINTIFLLVLTSGFYFIIARHTLTKEKLGKKVWIPDIILSVLILFTLVRLITEFNSGLPFRNPWLTFSLMLLFLRELGNYRIEVKKQYLNPAQLFIISFLGIILAGTFLLMLPRATLSGIRFIDALFTATSAVCVTGLAVVDTGKFFSPLGQTIIIILIQAGGLGIMTFTSYFGYFFKGGASYQNRLMIRDMTNTDRISDVFNTLKKILLITFLIEFAGAVMIFLTVDRSLIPETVERIFFSLFHSVSAFCNAGFSTLTNSLYETGYRYNYPLHLIISILIIFGGLGFPIVFNALSYLRHHILKLIIPGYSFSPWILGINTRIVLVTTVALLIGGTGLIYLTEYNNTLAEHNAFGKIVTAFFSATTPRTAGFNTIDTTALNVSTIMIVFLLMWIGASPGSTGGGIKTTTFAISVFNFLSLAKGKDRVEVFKREISPITIRRAYSAITLSLIVICTAVALLSVFEKDKDLFKLAFETVSAFGTVGLSLGITGSLSVPGKIIIVLTMFIGRVSMLTLLVAFMRRVVNLKYKLPAEDVLIN